MEFSQITKEKNYWTKIYYIDFTENKNVWAEML